MGQQFIYQVTDLTKKHGQKTILEGVNLAFYPGAKIGVLGLNGSGKSSLIKIIAGLDTNYEGKIVFDKEYKIGYLAQEPVLDETKTVKEVVQEGLKEIMEVVNAYEAVSAKLGEPLSDDEMNKAINEQGELLDKMDQVGGWDVDQTLDQAMEALRCPPNDAKVSVLSGGERRRVALCRLLLSKPDILLLDEPTNHLDAESVHWLEQFLKSFPGTVIAVTHDRYFLDNVAGWILELDRGEGIPWEGNYSTWLEQKSNRMANEEKTASKRQKALKRELEWVRSNAKGQQSKGKARLNAYEAMSNAEQKEKEAKLELTIPAGQRLGDTVIEVKDLTKSYDNRVLIEGLNMTIPKNAIVGIIGPNGVGKSTLFRMIMGEEQPDSGSITIGETVQLAYVDQSHEALKPEKTIFEVVGNGNDLMEVQGKELNVRAYISKFNFAGGDQQKKVGVLSGGERNRLHLAITLKEGGNVILLDEPTNDIDVNTLRALEEAIENFAGCVMVISHDRWFIDRLATHILAYEDDGQVRFYEGNYSDYEKDKKARLGDVAPRRPRFKNLL
jgi:ATP-binding cassette ChvD family protein